MNQAKTVRVPRLTSVQLLSEEIPKPSYDRNTLKVGIVHFGIGAFHRAHQAVYMEEILAHDPGDWMICGVSLRHSTTRDQMLPQNSLYTVAERSEKGDSLKVIGSVKEVLFAQKEQLEVLKRLADFQTKLVTMTISEKGYCHDPSSGKLLKKHPDILHDLANYQFPMSAIGYLVAGLDLRYKAGLPPYTVLSCDNLPENGEMLKNLVLEFAKIINPELNQWIADKGCFPSSMVDRIVPAVTENDKLSITEQLKCRDEAAVICEPFRQWVIENNFSCGLPDFQSVGVQLTDDIRPFEEMKLRLLNGTHSTIAYLGYLSSYEYVSDAMLDSNFLKFIREMMDEEITPTLKTHPSIDLAEYKIALLDRFKNPGLRHRTWQIAMDGSQKIPQRLLNTVREQVLHKRPFSKISLALAAWMRYILGVDEFGKAIEIRDPMSERFNKIAFETGLLVSNKIVSENSESYTRAILDLTEIFGEDLSQNSLFCTQIQKTFTRLLKNRSAQSIEELVKK